MTRYQKKRKIITSIFALVFTAYTLSSLFDLFKWDVKIVAHRQQWAKIIEVKEVANKIKFARFTTWMAKVRVDANKISYVDVRYNPAPQQGGCIPIHAYYLSNGKVYSELNVSEWRFGTSFGPCD